MVSGLEDVVAAETILSDVDGIGGHLVIRGHPLDEIAGRMSYEAVVALLLDGFFDDLPTGDDLTGALGAARRDVFERTTALLPSLVGLSLYDRMRAGVALMPDGDGLTDALRLIAAPAVLTPMLIRARAGQPPIAPDPSLGHAADILGMLGRADRSLAGALDSYLVTVCAHGLNASTFAARVVASTQAGLTSAVLAGLGALKGPLHGGAPGPVIAMLDAIAADGDPRRWLEREVSTGKRLMGFGHRICAPATPAPMRSRQRCGGSAARPHRPGASPLPNRSSAPRWTSCALPSRGACSRPMSNSSRRCCSKRWAFRPRHSPASSRWAG